MDTQPFKVMRTDAEWRTLLTPEQYAIMREHGTERPVTCALLHEKRQGSFACVGCGQPLFHSKIKFESGTGWPSFNEPIEGAVETRPTAASAWSAPRFTAPPAAATSAMSSTTARRRPACATASTAWR